MGNGLRQPGFSHWLDRENHLFMLEATGYALLALVKWGRMEEAAAPFKWLNSQRRRGGGFGSTQPTMVGGGLCVKHLVRVPDTQTTSDVPAETLRAQRDSYRCSGDGRGEETLSVLQTDLKTRPASGAAFGEVISGGCWRINVEICRYKPRR
ncbi:complement C3 alpha chain-like [Amphiprion ocellaris]|uniref:complement C3 alpha chain-like n=1 Tax=Amphiprion ocellaris TaxID=80972 RepID=UPI0024112385|nr:complement C3 alpha chain-like [Amphiprion ocellaris]